MSTKRGKSRSAAPPAVPVNPSSTPSTVDAMPLPLAELGRIRGVSRQAVHKASRPGGPLSAALLPDGSIDAAHPDVIGWLARGDARDDNGPDPLDDAADLSALAANVARWRAAKLRADARLADRRDLTHAGRLISSDLVRRHVLGYLDALNTRLLGDTAVTLVRRIRAASSSENAIEVVKDQISGQLALAKSQAIRALRAARTDDNPPPVETSEQLDAHERVNALVSETLAATMREKAGPRALDLVLRSFARHAAGKSWTAAIFDEAMALRPDVERDVLGALANVLVAHADDAVREADRALEAQHTEEASHAAA